MTIRPFIAGKWSKISDQVGRVVSPIVKPRRKKQIMVKDGIKWERYDSNELWVKSDD